MKPAVLETPLPTTPAPNPIAAPLTVPLAVPLAEREPHSALIHGVELHDDYAWLRDQPQDKPGEHHSPRVLAYLQAENAYTAQVMRPTEPLQQSLYDEILSHIKEDDVSVPYRDGDWEYLTRTFKGLQYARHYRYPAGNPSAEQLILDVNLLAQKDGVAQAFLSVGATSVSPDGRLLAYTTDTTGFRQYTLHLKDLSTGDLLPETAERVGSIAWAADSSTLFYTVEDEQTKRQDRLFRLTLNRPSIASPSGRRHPDPDPARSEGEGEESPHFAAFRRHPDPEQREGEGPPHFASMGTSVRTAVEIFHEPVLVFQEPDERFNLSVGRTRDRRYILLEIASHTTSETRFLASDQPLDSLKIIAARIDEEEYSVDHRDGSFYILTNWNAEQFRLMRAPVAGPGREHWQEILPEIKDSPLEDFDLFRDFLVAGYREAGLPVLRVFSLDPAGLPSSPNDIRLPDPAYEIFSDVNRDFNAATFRYAYQSLVRPASVFSYDVATQASTLLKQQEVPGGFDAANYASERLWFAAHDGTQVPISLVYRREVPGKDSFHKNSTSPLYVYGYGSYGYALPLGFSSSRLALLDRGLVMAYAHIRGGGELGDPWHDAGKMMHKRNTFTDFIEATEFLLREGYGDPARVAIEGGSAGGLLMGAVVNLAMQQGKPNLFRVVLSHVPFVDVMNTMLDASLPLTVAEYEEWGNPNEDAAFNYMLSYSPYDNLKPGPYPAMLVKTSLNDSQVMYWEPAKYVAKLRTLKTNATPLLLHINMDAGHGGASGRYDYLKEIAFDDAFLLRELGIPTDSSAAAGSASLRGPAS